MIGLLTRKRMQKWRFGCIRRTDYITQILGGGASRRSISHRASGISISATAGHSTRRCHFLVYLFNLLRSVACLLAAYSVETGEQLLLFTVGTSSDGFRFGWRLDLIVLASVSVDRKVSLGFGQHLIR